MRFAKRVVTKLLSLKNVSERHAPTVVLIALTAMIGSGSCRERVAAEGAGTDGPGHYDSYILALSWAPAFCAAGDSARTYRECDARRHMGFVVHGLWPERNDGEILENCGRVHPVGHQIVEDMLSIMPDRGLIQHEWRAHGSCTGLSPSAYFGLVKKAYSRIRIPPEFSERGRQLRTTSQQAEQQFQSAAGIHDAGSIRIACRRGELTEVRICLSRNLEPIPCSNQLKECRSPEISVRPIP